MDFDQWIGSYPDFPKPGILFRDISPLLASPEGMQLAKQKLSKVVNSWDADLVARITNVLSFIAKRILFSVAKN